MAFDDNTTPITPAPAAAPSSAPPSIPAPVPTMDLSGLAQPGSQPDRQTALQGSYEQAIANQNAALQKQTEIANQPTVVPAGGHTKLLAMVQGIAQGLSAAGTALATRGEKGGAEEVQQMQQADQNQKLKVQQVAMEQKNAAIQQQVMVGETNGQLAQSYLKLMTLPDEITKAHLAVSGEVQRQAGEAQTQAIAGAEFAKANWGLTPDQVSGKTPLTPQNLSISQTMLSRAVGNDQAGALAILGKDNSAVIEAQRVASIPTPTAQEISAAGQGLMVEQQKLKDTTAAKKDVADASIAQQNAALTTPKTQADIAKSRAQAAAADTSRQKNAFDLGQDVREVNELAVPDVTGFSSPLTSKMYDKRSDAFTKSKEYQSLGVLKGSYQQFNDTLNHIAQTGDMTGAESVVGLFNAIGISAEPLQGKGFRINANTIAEHQEARGIDQAAYQKLLALKTGAVITPKQLQDYSNIAAGVYHNSFVNAADEAHRQGLPVDFLPQGGGAQLDPINARIFTDVVLHAHPELAKNPQALKAAIANAASLDGWKVQ